MLNLIHGLRAPLAILCNRPHTVGATTGMTMPAWLKTIACVFLAFPFGWGIGVLVALVIAGPDFGQLPAATVGLGILASIVFAVWPSIKVDTRLRVLFFGSLGFIVIVRAIG